MIDYSKPAADELFDGADFEKFLHDRIKVEGKAGQLGDNVKIVRDGTFGIYFFFVRPSLTLNDNSQVTPKSP